MKVELDEMEPVLAGLVSRIGGLNGKKAIDALARAGKNDSSYSLSRATMILRDDSSSRSVWVNFDVVRKEKRKNVILELARGALHWWEVRQAILRRDSDLEQLESLVKSARLPEDYALDSLRRAAMRSLISN